MAIDFDGTGDQVNINVLTNWMRNVNKGSEAIFYEWDKPASETDSLLFVDRGSASASARFQVDLSSFAPGGARVRTRRLDGDAEDFSTGNTSVPANTYTLTTGTVDWSAVSVELFNDTTEDSSSPFTPGWSTGNTSDTDPDSAAIGGALNGIIHALYSWHRVLTLAEIECIYESDGAAMIYDDLQSMHLLDEGGHGTSVSLTADAIKDASTAGRTGTAAGNPVYATTRIRRRRTG